MVPLGHCPMAFTVQKTVSYHFKKKGMEQIECRQNVGQYYGSKGYQNSIPKVTVI